MVDSTHTFWRMTINNYDETDIALVQQGYPDHIRQLVYTFEEGKSGTPHIQAFIKMKRDCRITHMRKLFPGANFAFIDSAEYRLNSQRYAQKLDATARSPAVILNGDPIHTIEGILRRVVEYMIQHFPDVEDLSVARLYAERAMVVEDYTMAKIFVSSTYKTMWRDFGHEIYECLFHQYEQRDVENNAPTHTHTHSDEIFSQPDENADENIQSSSCPGGYSQSVHIPTSEDCESDQDSESSDSSGRYESGGSFDSSSDVSEEY